MLPKQNRLKNRKDFENIFKAGKGQRDGLLYLRFFPNKLKSSRFGFVASTKFSKKAVERNRIKRWLREAVQNKIKNIKTGTDIAVIVNPGFKADSFKDLEIKVEKLFKKAKLIK